MEGLGNGAPTQCFPSSPTVPLTSTLWPLCHHPAAQGVSFSCFQCSQYRDFHQLAPFEWYPRTDTIAVGQLSCRWTLYTEGTAPTVFPRPILTFELTKIAIGTGSLYSLLGGSFFPQHSTWGIETRYQQLH